ncbi:MAG: 3-dehydroquinate synthase [Bacteroidetes bacterium]|nr:3-dehydroquinate synthase [Bacteroidota bacterium]
MKTGKKTKAVVKNNKYPIVIGHSIDSAFVSFIRVNKIPVKKIIFLTDDNVFRCCLKPILNSSSTLSKAQVLTIKSGEKHKSINTVNRLWHSLLKLKADRNTVLVNIGGGVVTDLGGFVAATYKRGIRFINIPTTLLSMVDASVGGKVGIDFGGAKNQIGLVSDPIAVFIGSDFLRTLSDREIRSGFAEMIKHALLSSKSLFSTTQKISLKDVAKNNLFIELIKKSVEYKNKIAQKDPLEKGIRKFLNYGHTIGHAVEALLMNKGKRQLLHGEAIAIGLICETYLSFKILGFPKIQVDAMKKDILLKYTKVRFSKPDIEGIVRLTLFDKKNVDGRINFTLLKEIGSPTFDNFITSKMIRESIEYYLAD